MTRERIIATAAAENGTKELPPNSNKTKYGAWYGLNGAKWCAIFVSWVYDRAGCPLGFIETHKGYQSCQGGYNFWKASHQLTDQPQAGDIALFDWDGDGHCDHTGIFEAWKNAARTSFYSWEGNTAVDNNSNGGIVMRRIRQTSMVRAFASPQVLGSPSLPITIDSLGKGDKNARVAAMQKLLYDLHYDITVDGIFGSETVRMVKQFQKDNQLPVTGTVTTAVMGVMESRVAEPYTAERKYTSGSYLRKGNSGSAVITLQKALNKAGARPVIKVDGVFGTKTHVALKAFQKKNKLYVDGIAGPQTFIALGIRNV